MMLLRMVPFIAIHSLFILLITSTSQGVPQGGSFEAEFNPTVTASCTAGVMTISVKTQAPFSGVIHSRDYRNALCQAFGEGSLKTEMRLNLLESKNSDKYCGVQTNEVTEERSIPIAVRVHRTLELAEDKFYVISCGKSGFKTPNNDLSVVSLKMLYNGVRTNEVVYGKKYTLRVDVSRPHTSYGIRVQNCFSFSGKNDSVQLINEFGCPIPEKSLIISPFRYNASGGYADATLYQMFKFTDTNQVHLQCDIIVCKGGCPDPECSVKGDNLLPQARAVGEVHGDLANEDGVLMAATTVFVLEPGEQITVEGIKDCGIGAQWLQHLCLALGILLLIMMIINIFLCSSMVCNCTRDEIITKDPSVIDDYDPYKVTWNGSQYGSRYSLNTKPVGYTSGGSTRSYSTNSDHYSMVHSRPGSRYSGHGMPHHTMTMPPRGPSSTNGSHYSSRVAR